VTRAEAIDHLAQVIKTVEEEWGGGDQYTSARDALEVLRERSAPELPAICGAAEAGELLGMAATNVKRLSPPLVPVARLKMGPVFLTADVLAAKARREGSV
jgi:hypothetical protein